MPIKHNQTNFYLIAPVGVAGQDKDSFTYESQQILNSGSIVQIEVGKVKKIGVVIQKVSKPKFNTKQVILPSLTESALPTTLLELAQWLKQYYATPLGLVFQTILPSGLQKTRRLQKIKPHPIRKRVKKVFTNDQSLALQAIKKAKNGTFLLHGVTGSGKTEVYIEAAKLELAAGKSSIILVPEISLTPQLQAEFANHFSNLLLTHSRLTEAERHNVWLQALESQEPVVVIGPRSALFMPVKNLGLIVVDEAHESSYKQDKSPRYSALRAASTLAKISGAKLIIGSATPSIVDYYLAESATKPILKMLGTVKPTPKLNIKVVDLKNKAYFTRHRFFADDLLSSIDDALSVKKQTLVFHNRRGTTPTTMCSSCAWIAECPSCFMPLTLHADAHKLLCHLCGKHAQVPPSCPSCHNATVLFKGIGTKLIESELAKLYPRAKIARFDSDTLKDDSMLNRYQEIYDGKIDILVGTQNIAKGLDLPNLNTVGIVQADSGLLLPDFQAEERVFQLLYQVIGRVGRSGSQGNIVLQTFQPDHPIIKNAIERNFEEFYKLELAMRKKQKMPPFTYLLKLTCSYKTEKTAFNNSLMLAKDLRIKYKDIEVLGPTPSFYERKNGNYQWQLIIKSPKRTTLVEIAKKIPASWQADIDPASLL